MHGWCLVFFLDTPLQSFDLLHLFYTLNFRNMSHIPKELGNFEINSDLM